MSARIILLILCSFFSLRSVYALVYPASTPAGETPGGTYRTYFDNIFSSELDCNGVGRVVGGFQSDGTPICVIPAPIGLNILGSQTGDTLRYDGTDWVRSNLLYNNGIAIGIGRQDPTYILDVIGTANFTALRMPTGAGSGRILVSDASGNFAWSDYSSGSTASGIVGGTQNVIPKFGIGGAGLISSQFFDNGTEIGIGTSTPTAGYKIDITGGDILVNTLRIGRGGGNILSNIAFGWNALNSNATATATTGLGYGAFSSLVSGAGNIGVGNLAGSTLTSGSNNIFIGSSAQPSSGIVSNELNIGNWIYGSGGSIGIGIANPGAKLEVAGQIKITGGTPGAGKYLMSDGVGLASWEPVSASAVGASGVINGPEYYIPKFGQYGSGLYQSSLYELPSGFIGVGNTNPTANLDVSGTIRIRSGASLGYIFTSDATGIGRWVPASAASNAWLLTGNAGTDPSLNFLGTTDTQNLVIAVNSIERLRITNNGNILSLGGLEGGSTNSFLFGEGAGEDPMAKASSFYGNYQVAMGGQKIGAGMSGAYNVAIGGLNVGYAMDGENNVALGGERTGVGGGGRYNVAIGGGSVGELRGTHNVAIGGQGNSMMSGSYNVAIGSSAGVYDGMGGMDGTDNVYIGTYAQGIQNGSNQFSLGNIIYGTGMGMTGMINGRVGIGTMNPGSKLTISGGTIQIINGTQGAGRFLVSDANGIASWQPTTATLSGSYWSLSGNTISSGAYIGTNNAQDFVVRTNNIERLRILSTSNASGQIATLTGGDLNLNSATLGRGRGGDPTNTVFGRDALSSNNYLFDSYSTAIGYAALYSNTGGVENTAVGQASLYSNTTGIQNTGLGVGSLAFNTIGSQNTAFGHTALQGNTTGNNNTAIGYRSLIGNTTGRNNIAIGMQSLEYNTNGNDNVVIGQNAIGGAGGLTGTYTRNVAIGRQAGMSLRNGSSDNTLIGASANASGSNNIVIGANTSTALIGMNNLMNIGNLIYGTGMVGSGAGNIGIGTTAPTAKLDIAGDIRISGGSPGAGKFLVSDATGLASWQNTTSTLSGSYWALVGNNIGVNDFIGSLNAQDLRFRTNNTQRMVITSAGNVGIGVANPTTANLELSGSALISGDLTVQGRVITDTIVNRTITNVSISGNLLPDANAPLAVRNIGSATQRWNNLFLSGQITIGGGSPALNRVLVSDATGLGTWSSVFSGTTLASAISGGSSGYLSVFGNGGIGLNNSRIFQTGSFLGIGTITPGYSLDVSGTGNFIGLRIPTGASNNFILTSDASGNARWSSGFSGSYSSSGVTGGTQNNLPKFGTGGNGLITSQIYDNGSVVGIGTGSANGAKVVIDSGIDDDTGLRFARVDIGSALQANNVIALGVNASGKVLPISPISNIAVYTGVLRTTVLTPNPDLNTFNITYDFNRYFGIPGKQSFVVSQGNGPSYNGPYYRENGVSSVCSWNGTFGTSPYDCATAGPDGLSASPNNSFTMTAKGDTFGYQIALGARGDAALFARSGRFNGSQTGGLYTNDSPFQTPAPWNKIVTVPVNHPEYFFINTGLNSQLQAIPGGGNVGIGTSTPGSRFEVWSGATSETLLHMRGTNNVGLGLGALEEDQTGNANTAVGAESMYIITNGYSNTAMGYRSLRQTQAGFNNSAFGQEASYNNNGGSWNSALGYQALYSSTSGTGNIALGSRALYNLASGHNNIAIGFEALRVIAGSSVGQNIGIGHQALYSTTASQLTAVGHRALYTNSSGLRNTAFGFQALYDMSTQSDSTAIGYDALTNATGLGNTALGSMAGDNITTGTNNIVIGANVDAQVATASNQLNIGNWIYGSGGNIGIGATDPDAKLEVNGQIKITGGTPAAGRVLTSDANGLATWQTPSGGGGGGGGWSLTGDAGTSPGTNFIGTTDAVDFTIYTNGTEKVRVESGGDVGIGTNNPTSRLDVNGTFELGASGSQLSGILKATINRDLPSIANNACNAQTFTVNNAITSGTAMISPANALNDRLFITYARVSAANTVEAKFCNVSGGAINMTAMDFYVTVIQ